MNVPTVPADGVEGNKKFAGGRYLEKLWSRQVIRKGIEMLQRCQTRSQKSPEAGRQANLK